MSLRALDPTSWNDADAEILRALGEAVGRLNLNAGEKLASAALAGRLYVAKSGWLLLSVPNALVRGVYDALPALGAELPRAGVLNVPGVADDVLNAHISVMTADEVDKIGADNINERGRMFGYMLGALEELAPRNIDGVSKLWVLQVAAPQLAALRKSYGLTPLLGGHPFHITVAVRRTGVLGKNHTSKFDNPGSRGALKAAADKLPGGAADNASDSQFSPQALDKGVQHEREHTDDDQIAKEIAKDHLYEEPAYYEDQEAEKVEKSGMSELVRNLRQAKEHSDAKRYDQKRELLRRLMQQAPQDWEIDDDKPRYKGVTHKPTKFQFHTDPTAIPDGVRKKIAQSPSVYWDQLKNSLVNPKELIYDSSKPVFENIYNHFRKIKSKGDWILQSRRNHDIYRAQLDPQYRHQLALQSFYGNSPQPASYIDRVIERYGGAI